ncbi:hypothetical protein [Nocardioides sp. AE5]|uniref:hypothetical protein n=1 Tax=Nocardioides sp. AE5 TaxID=2962573 RepID=UPI002881D93C|nr:hypothetical protein [Nocardioides sp. AE5]MDT0202377.1 hypothetical protein [Nocardioides sp. AE5]
MSWLFTIVVITFAGVIAVLAVTAASSAAMAPLEPITRHGMKVAHAAGAVIALVAGLKLLQGHQPDEVWISAGYAIAVVGVPLILLTRVPDEDQEAVEPPSLWVVAIAAVTMAVLLLRLQQTW